MQDLGTVGTPDSIALGIDDSDRIVGGSYDDRNGDSVAFVWQGGVMYDLNAVVTDLGPDFPDGYGPVLRSVLFVLERHDANRVTGVTIIAGGAR